VQRVGRQSRGFEPPRSQILHDRVGRRQERCEPAAAARSARAATTEYLPRFSDWK
jgi:hypothetical protein